MIAGCFGDGSCSLFVARLRLRTRCFGSSSVAAAGASAFSFFAFFSFFVGASSAGAASADFFAFFSFFSFLTVFCVTSSAVSSSAARFLPMVRVGNASRRLGR